MSTEYREKHPPFKKDNMTVYPVTKNTSLIIVDRKNAGEWSPPGLYFNKSSYSPKKKKFVLSHAFCPEEIYEMMMVLPEVVQAIADKDPYLWKSSYRKMLERQKHDPTNPWLARQRQEQAAKADQERIKVREPIELKKEDEDEWLERLVIQGE